MSQGGINRVPSIEKMASKMTHRMTSHMSHVSMRSNIALNRSSMDMGRLNSMASHSRFSKRMSSHGQRLQRLHRLHSRQSMARSPSMSRQAWVSKPKNFLSFLYFIAENIYKNTLVVFLGGAQPPPRIKGRATNFGAGQDGRQFFGVQYFYNVFLLIDNLISNSIFLPPPGLDTLK